MSVTGEKMERSELEAAAFRFLRAHERDEAQLTETDLVQYFSVPLTSIQQDKDGLVEALKDSVRMLEAVRYSAGLNGQQLVRLQKAKDVVAKAEKSAPIK